MKYKVTLSGKTYEIEVEAGQAMCLAEYEAFGFLLPKAYRKARSLLSVLLWGFLFVVFAECTQYVTNLGTFDVDDIILNMASFLLGYLPVGIAGLFRKPKKKHKK